MASRRPLLLALAVVAMGLVDQLLAQPPAAATTTLAGCKWCASECPRNLAQFCWDQGCGGGYDTCSTLQCLDVYGQWRPYTIECGLF